MSSKLFTSNLITSNLIICLTQNENIKPYTFLSTGIKVYSFEEALYHCYNYWTLSLEEFVSNDFVNWVYKELELGYLANEISALLRIEDDFERLTSFLTITDYFSDNQLKNLDKEILNWKNRLEWEKLKEKGDFFFNNKNYVKAINFYNKALENEENQIIYNNIGLSYAKLGNFERAIGFFEKSFFLNQENENVIFNYTESLILNRKFDLALKLIDKLDGEKKFYLLALLEKENKRYKQSLEYYKKAFSNNKDYLFDIIEICIKLKNYEEAFKLLDENQEVGSLFYAKKGSIYFYAKNNSKAIEQYKKAIELDNKNINYLLELSNVYIANKDFELAEDLLAKAFEIEPKNKKVLLANAKIKRIHNKEKDFKSFLSDILDLFKINYRKNLEYKEL